MCPGDEEITAHLGHVLILNTKTVYAVDDQQDAIMVYPPLVGFTNHLGNPTDW